jgi:Trk K+ transport system NAD-binding subunit
MHVVLAGLDGLGLRTLEQLLADGHRVTCAAPPGASAHADDARALGATVVQGDHRRTGILREAGLASADALIVTVEDDVANLHCALAAQDERPGLRVVVRMFSPTLGDRVAALVPGARCLSASALAVPALVAAALVDEGGQRLEVLGRRLVVRPRGTVAEPLAVLPGDLELVDDDTVVARPGPAGQRRELIAAVRHVLGDRRLHWLGVAIAILVAIATAVFAVFHEQPVEDALYTSVTAVTSIGFGDLSLLGESFGVKAFAMLVMVVGAVATAILIGIVADAFLSLRLARLAGGPPPPGRGDHVVVCGLGTVGFRVLEQLVARGIDVVAVEADEDGPFVPVARALGVHVMIGRVGVPGVLEAVDVAHCRCVVVATSDDAANLETALEARALRPDLRVVLRLFDPDLAERAERAFGIHRSLSVSALAAPAFALAAVGRHVHAPLAIGDDVVLVEERRAGAAMSAGALAAGDAMLAVHRSTGAVEWSPAAAATLGADDALVVLCETRAPAGTVPEPA